MGQSGGTAMTILAEGAQSRGHRIGSIARRYLPEIILSLAVLVALFILHDMPITHDVVAQFWIARQMMHGAVLYRDIWEINPPLWFWSAIPVHYVAAWLHVAPLRLLVALIIGAGGLSALTSCYLAGFISPGARLSMMLLTFWLVEITPIYDFGQREQLALMCAIPYAALIARRSAGIAVPSALALLVGMAAAYGFALKHYFIAVPVMLELWLIVRNRAQWRLVRPETVALAVVALAYGLAVLAFAPAFFTDAVPMVQTAYHGFEATWEMILVRPWVVIWVCIIGFFLTFGGAFGRQANPLVTALLIVAIGFGFAYFLQRKGWLYHTVPVTGAAALALGIRLGMTDMRRLIPMSIGLTMIALPILLPFKTGYYANFFRAEIDPVLDTVPRGQSIFIAAADPMWVWPTLEDKGLIWSSRLPVYWMIPAIAHGEVIGPYPAPLRALAKRIQEEAALEIYCSSPALIVFERRRNYVYQPSSFDVRRFFLRHAGMRTYLARNYRELTPTPSLYIYRRATQAEPARAGTECPTFR
ncbi:GtrA family protein [Sphingobium sp.]|uniref:GtrA family protein n=1 Tax=Sphingobium sp. TaxID=1912891 RepID=UPI003BB683DA